MIVSYDGISYNLSKIKQTFLTDTRKKGGQVNMSIYIFNEHVYSGS